MQVNEMRISCIPNRFFSGNNSYKSLYRPLSDEFELCSRCHVVLVLAKTSIEELFSPHCKYCPYKYFD